MIEFNETPEHFESYTEYNQLDYDEATELQDEDVKSSDYPSLQPEGNNEISDIEYQYEQAKLSIEISRTREEQDYWIKRADELWQERDIASAELSQKIAMKK